MSTLAIVIVTVILVAAFFLWLNSGVTVTKLYGPQGSTGLIKDQCRQYDEEYPSGPDISEPVYAIARALTERPGTFRVEPLDKPGPASGCAPRSCDRYRITDRDTGLSATVVNSYHGFRHCRISLPFELTGDEKEHLWAAGERWIRERQQRAADYRNTKRRKEWAEKYGVAS